MTKRNWRDALKALGNQVDPEQDEQVKKTKIGIHFFSKQPQSVQYYWRLWDCPMENKYTRYKALQQVPQQCHVPHRLFWCALPECVNSVLFVPDRDLDDRLAKLMKLIQHKSRSRKGFDSELIELIDDFHNKYQTLYSLNEYLKGHVLENICVLENKDNSSSSSSSSDSFEELKRKCARLSECLVEREREIEYLSMEARELGEQNDGLRDLIQELETTSKQREEKLFDLLIELEENEADLVKKDNDLQVEVDSLWSEKEVVYQEGEIVSVLSPHKSKSEEASGFLFHLELLKAKFERKNMDFKKIFEEKKGLENQVNSIMSEYAQLEIENEYLNVRVSELEESLMERDHDVFVLEEDLEGLKNDSSARIKALEKEVANLQNELMKKEEYYQEIISGKEDKTQIKAKFYESNLKKLGKASEEMQKKFQESVGNTKLAIENAMGRSATTNKIMNRPNNRFLNRKNNVMNEKDEIMELKERICKLENDMIGLGEEKRDAIRQLCLWIDYHKSQNSNLKKTLSNLRVFRGPSSN